MSAGWGKLVGHAPSTTAAHIWLRCVDRPLWIGAQVLVPEILADLVNELLGGGRLHRATYEIVSADLERLVRTGPDTVRAELAALALEASSAR